MRPGHYPSTCVYISCHLLVNFYFSTTLAGTTEWNSCGPPPAEDPEEEDCVFLRPVVGGGTNRIPWVRWLSAAHECDWAGITCATIGGSLRVTEIELGTFGRSLFHRVHSFYVPRK